MSASNDKLLYHAAVSDDLEEVSEPALQWLENLRWDASFPNGVQYH